jgi:hypothetical protein
VAHYLPLAFGDLKHSSAGFQDFVAKFDRQGLIAAIGQLTDTEATRAA